MVFTRAMAKQQNTFPLLALPLELRQLIYGFSLPDEILAEFTSDSLTPHAERINGLLLPPVVVEDKPGLLFVNKETYKEMREIFWKRVVLDITPRVFYLEESGNYSVICCLKEIANVGKLRLSSHDWQHNVTQKLCLLPNLKDIEITIGYNAFTAVHAYPDSDEAQSLIFGILRDSHSSNITQILRRYLEALVHGFDRNRDVQDIDLSSLYEKYTITITLQWYWNVLTKSMSDENQDWVSYEGDSNIAIRMNDESVTVNKGSNSTTVYSHRSNRELDAEDFLQMLQIEQPSGDWDNFASFDDSTRFLDILMFKLHQEWGLLDDFKHEDCPKPRYWFCGKEDDDGDTDESDDEDEEKDEQEQQNDLGASEVREEEDERDWDTVINPAFLALLNTNRDEF